MNRTAPIPEKRNVQAARPWSPLAAVFIALFACGILAAQVDQKKIADCALLYKISKRLALTGSFDVNFPVANSREFYSENGKSYYLRPPGYALVGAFAYKFYPSGESPWQEVWVSLWGGILWAGVLAFIFTRISTRRESLYVALTLVLGSPLTPYLSFLWHESLGAVILGIAFFLYHRKKRFWAYFFGGLTLLFSQFAFVTAAGFFGACWIIDVLNFETIELSLMKALSFLGGIVVMSFTDFLLMGTPLPLQAMSPVDIGLSPKFIFRNIDTYFFSGASLTLNAPVFFLALFVPLASFLAVKKYRRKFFPILVSFLFSVVSIFLNMSNGECQLSPRHLMPLVVLCAYSYIRLLELSPRWAKFLNWIFGPLAILSIVLGVFNTAGYLLNCEMTQPAWSGMTWGSLFEFHDPRFPLRTWGYGMAILAILSQLLLFFPNRHRREY